MANTNTFEKIAKVPISFERFTPICNTVLFEWNPSLNEKTLSGIYVPMIDGKQAQNVVTIGKVVKLPKYLYYDKKNPSKSMPWKTEIEAQIGDLAVCNHMDSNRAWLFKEGDKEYRIINYQGIDAIKRVDRIIPVNGNILLKPLKYSESALDHSVQREHKNIFEVKYVGKRNLEYSVPEYVSFGKTVYREDFKTPIHEGDKVIIHTKFLPHLRPLENDIHAKIDGGEKYIVCKRYMIAGIYQR